MAPQNRKPQPHFSNFYHFIAQGFSLVEVTIAIAVVAFSIAGILAMLPMALRSASESHEETRANHIAQSIFSGLLLSNASLLLGEIPQQSQPLNLSTSESWVLKFDYQSNPVGPPVRGSIAQPTDQKEVQYLVQVTTRPNPALKFLNQTPFDASNCTLVEVLVTSPAKAPLQKRNRYSYVTLLKAENP
ncbi:MAG: hypothetical protein NZL93_00845 [Chthoniobacterales bacterium]|nr:hypothetical protein [Chthoniobacterales bacterium]